MAKTKKEKEDRLAQQRLCKRRRYAEIKNDPRLYAIEKEKQRTRYLKRKAEKKITSIAEKNKKKQKIQRTKWKENTRRYRQSKKEERQKLPEPVQIDIQENQEVIQENSRDPLKGIGDRVYTTKEVSLIVRRVRYKEQKKQGHLREIIKTLKRQNALYRMRELRRRQREENINEAPEENESLQSKKPTAIKVLTKFKKSKKTPKELLQSKITNKTIREVIHAFYNDDSNSVIRAGKREFITKNKIRHQKRFLTATLIELYKKFIKETNIAIHYSTFCKERPFWVLFPKPQNRDTCLCIVHTNIDLLINALNKAKILKSKNSVELLIALCCDPKYPECLERTCSACAGRVPEYMEFSNDVLVTYYEWKRVKKEITTNKGIVKKQQMTSKEKETEVPLKLIQKLETALPKFFLHSYKVLKQYTVMKNLRENLRFDEAMIHVDFSENYALKYAEEVQSFHFAGSRSQVCLHTAVIYTNDFTTGIVKATCVCTISKCTRHDVPAIWAHLIPLLQEAYKQNPFIETIHFLSDSPSSQYRNKYMFYVTSQMSQDFPQIKRVSWNYSESGHGKGAPDGVGAVLKRTADQMVRFGEDVGSFSQFCNAMNDRIENIVIKVVEEADVIEKEKKIPKALKPFKGTLSVHQIIWDKFQRFTTMRSISCFFCDAGEICHHNKHLGFIENKKRVPDLSHHEDYDVVIPLSQIKPSVPKTMTHTTIGTHKHLQKKLDRHANVENQPSSCSKSIVNSNKGKTAPGKRIHILSDITIKDVSQLNIKKKKIKE